MEGALTPVAPADTEAGIQHVPGIDSLGAVRPARHDRPQGIRPAGGAVVEGSLDTVVAHSAGGAGSRAINRDIQSDRRTERGRLDRASAGAIGTIGARVVTTRAPVLDGRSERAVIRTVPRITLRGLQRSSRARRPRPCPHRHDPVRRTPRRSSGRTLVNDRAARPSGSQRSTLQLFAGGIMRGRKRSRARGPMRGREAFRRGHRVSSETDARVDESLRALARLLGRQAAREVFNRAVSREADRSIEEGRE